MTIVLRYCFFFCLILVNLSFSEVVANETQTALTHPITKTPSPPTWQYQLLRTIPREKHHFTEGLVFADNYLFESTGQYGKSQLHRYDANNLSPSQHINLNTDRFAEGLTVIQDQLYQLSWKEGDIFVYDFNLQSIKTLRINSEGWGLTTDGESLIISDGSSTLSFRDRNTAQESRRITVHDASGKQWKDINELEWINGVILANVWHQDTALIINPDTGYIIGQYNFEALSQIVSKAMPNRNGEQVLNGMAWNSATQTLLLTGKDWPSWFEVSLLPIPSAHATPSITPEGF
jgi:glutamine cyclotransferase